MRCCREVDVHALSVCAVDKALPDPSDVTGNEFLGDSQWDLNPARVRGPLTLYQEGAMPRMEIG